MFINFFGIYWIFSIYLFSIRNVYYMSAIAKYSFIALGVVVLSLTIVVVSKPYRIERVIDMAKGNPAAFPRF